jgi:RIO-like serine/threonine protein kinase
MNENKEFFWRTLLYPHTLAPPTNVHDLTYVYCKHVNEQHPNKPLTLRGSRFEVVIRRKVKQLHQMGIFHGDLHKDNIVIDDRTDEIYFIDFEHTMFIKDMKEKDIQRMCKFLEMETYGYPNTLQGLLDREMDMPFMI